MTIVESCLPKPPTSQYIDIPTMDVGSSRVLESLDIEVAKEHSGVGVLLRRSWLTKVEGPSNICGSITIYELEGFLQILSP